MIYVYAIGECDAPLPVRDGLGGAPVMGMVEGSLAAFVTPTRPAVSNPASARCGSTRRLWRS